MYILAEASPSVVTLLFLVLAIGLALGFEFVNGFHDTANAVATVIYTNTMRPVPAVIWSGLWNLIGVLLSSGAVAFSIVALLPVELVVNVGSAAGFAMVFALLLSAIIWNLGTWWLALPASSSHTLIGSILGVGLANSWLFGAHAFGAGVNWGKAQEVGLSLLISPVIGFCAAGLLLLAAKVLIRNPALYEAPEGKTPPPLWIRGLLVLTCTGVSFAHGSNDGQKGMGLIVLILVGILPGMYALNMASSHEAIQKAAASVETLGTSFEKDAGGISVTTEEAVPVLSQYLKAPEPASPRVYAALAALCHDVKDRLRTAGTFEEVPESERGQLRTDFYLLSNTLKKLSKEDRLDPSEAREGLAFAAGVDAMTNYIPAWVKYAVALALGLGTMIGWKRIVITVGEKIGKSHLTYGQGASAELVAMGTILAADHYGLPVSTTHVLSSGVAGTMAANRSGLQMDTLRNILMAWVLTLPVCIFLGAAFFAFGLNILFLLGIR